MALISEQYLKTTVKRELKKLSILVLLTVLLNVILMN